MKIIKFYQKLSKKKKKFKILKKKLKRITIKKKMK